ncbi:MAG: hypothetical protein A2084_03380 [Tenericutes bacterium GWC2_39_45]|nr:MAG: hypothetical protein A2Y43_01365 [Tenericutes bacterium GWA2_38_26]OHE30998.1 MAG: hypothetical protein A2084_03380 [Tenericutes bacterium GWC2_39_45]HBG32646.1 hypothetical protein [Acholeplasmataceae bacterium]HCB66656.1 hypothetical protein [Acholeplasmataceae bacterium]
MGEYILKRFSITLILVSASLNIIFNVSSLIQIYIGGLDFLEVYINLYLRFGDLGIIFGFVGLYVSSNQHMARKHLSLAYVMLGFLKFLLVEFMLIDGFVFWSVFITGLMIAAIVLLVTVYKENDHSTLNVKGIVLSMASSIYWIAFLATSIIAHYNDFNTDEQSVTNTVLPFFYVVFMVGLCVYYYEYYKESFLCKNAIIRIQNNEEEKKDY